MNKFDKIKQKIKHPKTASDTLEKLQMSIRDLDLLENIISNITQPLFLASNVFVEQKSKRSKKK